ncbi:MAG: hypothetical protein JEZ03_07090 [Bacteroidales bacterium]|nr:hypothetical protein [Bacteroidales bacterium]
MKKIALLLIMLVGIALQINASSTYNLPQRNGDSKQLIINEINRIKERLVQNEKLITGHTVFVVYFSKINEISSEFTVSYIYNSYSLPLVNCSHFIKQDSNLILFRFNKTICASKILNLSLNRLDQETNDDVLERLVDNDVNWISGTPRAEFYEVNHGDIVRKITYINSDTIPNEIDFYDTWAIDSLNRINSQDNN